MLQDAQQGAQRMESGHAQERGLDVLLLDHFGCPLPLLPGMAGNDLAMYSAGALDFEALVHVAAEDALSVLVDVIAGDEELFAVALVPVVDGMLHCRFKCNAWPGDDSVYAGPLDTLCGHRAPEGCQGEELACERFSCQVGSFPCLVDTGVDFVGGHFFPLKSWLKSKCKRGIPSIYYIIN